MKDLSAEEKALKERIDFFERYEVNSCSRCLKLRQANPEKSKDLPDHCVYHKKKMIRMGLMEEEKEEDDT